MSRVAVVFTGGTISMVADPVAGGNVPTLDAGAILSRTPGLDEIAEVVPVDLGRTPASHFSFEQLFVTWHAIREAASDPAIDGVVVVQGTDTLEETAFFWDLLHAGPKPIVVTGAMRAASDPDYEGPANLRDAVRCAASAELRDAGVVVVLAGAAHAADAVTKAHTTALDAFQSLDVGPLARVEGTRIVGLRARGPRRHVAADRAVTRIALVTAHTQTDPEILDAIVAARPAGIVVEATGGGNTSPLLLDAATRVMADGGVAVLTSRCPAGAAGTAYAFPGGGATWVRAGAVLAGHLGGPKARVALALGLGAGLDGNALAALLTDPPGWGPALDRAPTVSTGAAESIAPVVASNIVAPEVHA